MPKVKKHKTVLAVRQTVTKPQKQTASKHSETKPTKERNAAPKPKQQRAAWTCASIIDQQSADALSKLLAAAETHTAGATIKSLTLAPHIVHKKPTFAVTVETLKHLPLLKAVLGQVGLLQQHEHQLSPAAAYVLMYELLFGQGFRSKGPAEAAVLDQQHALRSALQGLLQEAGVPNAAAWLAQQHPEQQQQRQQMVPHPRFARVNTLKAPVADVLEQLATEAAGAQSTRGAAGAASSKRTQQGRQAGPVVDELLPDVLVFPPGTDLHDHPLVQQGVLVLQSKASCMPAHALQAQAGWHIVDCCAAPGNKTTHVAALLAAAGGGSGSTSSQQGSKYKAGSKKRSRQQAEDTDRPATGHVFAFDKDPKRLKRLQANVARTGAGGIVQAQLADFLKLDPTAAEFKQVRGVILDPSCSGSGTVVSRMDHLLPAGAAQQAADPAQHDLEARGSSAAGDGSAAAAERRVEQLAKFQEAALLHALKFPALQRLVYSTCSVHQRENEDVVAAVLPAAAAAAFRLADPFPAWHRRGLPVLEGSEKLVRTDPYEDGTDGFFVAVFERQ